MSGPQFEVLKKLGQGGQGTCYLVREVVTNTLMVRKSMRLDNGNTDRDGSCIEVKINRLLPYFKRIPRMICYGLRGPADQDILFEFCDAGDLYALIRNYAKRDIVIPEAFLWHVYIHIAEALAFIHDGTQNGVVAREWKCVIHRDVKPENIFLKWPKDANKSRTYPNVLLGDLGLASVTTSPDHRIEPKIGTIIWQPPELPIARAAGDVWALGACIQSMADEGRPPLKSMPAWWKTGKDRWEECPLARTAKNITNHYSRELQFWMLRACCFQEALRASAHELVTMMVPQGRKIRDSCFQPLEPWSYPVQESLKMMN